MRHYRQFVAVTMLLLSIGLLPTMATLAQLPDPVWISELAVTKDTTGEAGPELWRTAELVATERNETQLEFFIAGAVAFILLFGLAAAIMLREPGFLLFGLASLCFLLFRWSINGVADRELWPEASDWSQQLSGVFLALLGLLITQLHRTLLETRSWFPRIDVLLKLQLISYCGFALAFLLFPQPPLMLAMSLWGLLLCMGSPVLGWLAARRGIPLHGYAFAGYVLPWQMIILLYFTGTGWLPAPPGSISDYAMVVTSLLASLIIPVGLGARVIQLRREKEAALKQELQDLEELVSRRTVELRQAKHDAEQQLSDHRRFLDMSSHELRSPLASISIASELLTDHARENRPPPLNVIQRVQRAVSRMTVYLDNLIALHHTELDPSWAVRRSWHSPHLLLDGVLDKARSASPNRELIVQIGKLPESLNFDLNLMNIAVRNLLDNAMKSSPAQYPITVRAFIEGETLRIRVTGRGSGIPAEEQACGFNKHSCGEQLESLPGEGLGLIIAREIARRHQGDIELLSSTGGRTTVQITIPVQ